MPDPKLSECVEAFGEDKGTEVFRLISGDLDPETYASVEAWVRQCYHRPDDEEMILCALSEVLGGFGTEGIRAEDGGTVASYVNMGDSYATTVLLDSASWFFQIGSWGDFVEAWERENEEALP